MSVETLIQNLQADELYRELSPAKELLDFSSNDYLGLAKSENIRSKLVEAINAGCPLGSTGSRLISGSTAYHELVEDFLGTQYQSQSALLFCSGYMANIGVIAALDRFDPHFFSDELNHASLIDGIRLTKAAKSIFCHNDLNDLDEKLGESKKRTKVIVTESIFSQEGDRLQVDEILKIAIRHNAWLIVDEAHATGVYGESGLGLLARCHLTYDKIVTVHTGGKALGAQGAFVISSLNFRKLVINCARSFIYTTAISPINALHLKFGFEEAQRLDLVRAKIEFNRHLFNKSLSPIYNMKSTSPIIPLVLKSNSRVLEMRNRLELSGYAVGAIRSPTVPKGSERLRITLKGFHSPDQICALAELINGASL